MLNVGLKEDTVELLPATPLAMLRKKLDKLEFMVEEMFC